jgi:amidase
VRLPDRSLRVAVSTKPPVGSPTVDKAYADAALDLAAVLDSAGHVVHDADPPYGWPVIAGAAVRVAAGVAEEAAKLDYDDLERRSKPMVRIGQKVRPLAAGSLDRRWWRRRAGRFFRDFDVLVTPALAGPPPPAEGWCLKSYSANIRNGLYARFTPPWNLAGYPAMAVPAGMHPCGVPLSVQLVAPDGGEELLLSVAKQIEALAPWPRHPPAYSA